MIGYYFGWPHGQIWPNLAASGICGVLVWWRLHAEAVVRHAELVVRQELAHRELKRHAAEQRDALSRQLTVHCSDIKDHVTAMVTSPDPAQAGRQVLDELKRQQATRPPGGGRM